MSCMMEYEHISTYLSGADYEARQTKEDWKEIYGEDNPQAAIDDLVKLVENMVDLLRQYTLDDRNAIKMYSEKIIALHLQQQAENAR